MIIIYYVAVDPIREREVYFLLQHEVFAVFRLNHFSLVSGETKKLQLPPERPIGL